MKNTRIFSTLIISALLMFFIPFSTFASNPKKVTNTSGNFDFSSLTTTSSKPTIYGNASGTKTVKITINKKGENKIFYRSQTIKVKNGIWKNKISKKLPDGIYKIELFDSKGTKNGSMATETLNINVEKVNSNFVVANIPLLTGGLAHKGESVPISYLQITNTGKEPETLKGFWIKQNGSASDKSIVGLSTVDDKEGSRNSTNVVEGKSPFKDNLALAPTNVVFAPGQMKLFTIKAVLGNNISLDLGKQLKIDVVSIETDASVKGQFPITGTTWTISN